MFGSMGIKASLAAILAVLYIFSCSLSFIDKEPYTLTIADKNMIKNVFPESIIVEIEPIIFTSHMSANGPYGAYDTREGIIVMNADITIQPNYVVHEATHFYQKKTLKRSMASCSEYRIPKDLSRQANIEQEANIVALYAALLESGDDDLSLHQYISTYLHL